MQKTVSLVSLLVLEWAWALHGAPVLPETLIPTQDNFDLERFLGKWYEVAVVSNCPHYMQRKTGNPVIVALEMQHVTSESNVTMTASLFRNGLCKKTLTDYSLTDTPGRFFYHIARLGVDVDAFVVQTNYDEYALMILLSTEISSGNKTTIVKLHSRSKDVSPTVLEDFKTLVRQQGIDDNTIIMNQDKGECAQGEHMTANVPLQKSKRHVMSPLAVEDTAISG
ncbi:protein AMBP-like [Sphaeramia orbicularis]|uniref:protein AMBP-like n=1 Tax=Sphaeramia orbicularis TaxID=375764 RepID=UPI00117DDDA1|nr:protein AMBP-like [Sphaeramia orbicularis]